MYRFDSTRDIHIKRENTDHFRTVYYYSELIESLLFDSTRDLCTLTENTYHFSTVYYHSEIIEKFNFRIALRLGPKKRK